MLTACLSRVARRPDGAYRILASKGISGKDMGPFLYYGTRSDDPNDIHPHEHRRELRALRVSAAWLNHDDSRAINTRDFLQDVGGRQILRHYLIDFGSTLGSGSTQAQGIRAGNEYIWEARPTLITMLTLGFYVRPWIKVDYPELPAIGRFEANYFQPERWKPEYPNPAFVNARPDDLFWGARHVVAITDEAILAVVRTAEYTDPEATSYLTQTLITRRDKIGQLWLNTVLPVEGFALSPSGTFTFSNVAVDTKVSTQGEGYTVEWASFDNTTLTATPVGDPQSTTGLSASAPAGALDGEFVQVAVTGNTAIIRDGACPAGSYSASSRPGGSWSASSACSHVRVAKVGRVARSQGRKVAGQVAGSQSRRDSGPCLSVTDLRRRVRP